MKRDNKSQVLHFWFFKNRPTLFNPEKNAW